MVSNKHQQQSAGHRLREEGLAHTPSGQPILIGHIFAIGVVDIAGYERPRGRQRTIVDHIGGIMGAGLGMGGQVRCLITVTREMEVLH